MKFGHSGPVGWGYYPRPTWSISIGFEIEWNRGFHLSILIPRGVISFWIYLTKND